MKYEKRWVVLTTIPDRGFDDMELRVANLLETTGQMYGAQTERIDHQVPLMDAARSIFRPLSWKDMKDGEFIGALHAGVKEAFNDYFIYERTFEHRAVHADLVIIHNVPDPEVIDYFIEHHDAKALCVLPFGVQKPENLDGAETFRHHDLTIAKDVGELFHRLMR